jgi:hypothetical protein
MKFGKVLRNTAMASAVAVLAFGSMSAFAYTARTTNTYDGSGVFGAHVGASVLGTTTITESNAVSFGNIAVSAAGTMTMDQTGARVGAGGISPLDGGNSSTTILDNTYGAAQPGTYPITNGQGTQSLYVTYFVSGGGGNQVGNSHTSNPILLSNGTDTLYVYSLVDNGQTVTAGDLDAAGAKTVVDLTGGAFTLKVGGTIEALNTVSDGAYRGTFDIMLHY